MRRTVLLSAALLVAVGMVARAEESSKLNSPPPGFTALFNGRDLTNWKVAGKTAEYWKVVDGVITYDGKAGDLVTEKDFGDFILYVDWKITKGGDSGIFLRGAPQVQIWDNKEGSGGLWNNSKHSNKPLVFADSPIGEWNTFKIQLGGENVTVHLNGKLVVDNLPMDTIKWRKKGPIVLQNHGSATPIATITLAREPKPQIVAWATDRKDGGRGFGFTGCHFHKLWGIEGFRGLVLNAIVWTAKIDVPKEGVQSTVPSEMLEESRKK